MKGCVMAITPDEFKNTLRLFPSGVTIVTVKAGDETHGLTVSAFASVSANPPLIAVFVDHRGRTCELLDQEDAVFAVNILREDQQELSNRFAWQEDRFAMGDWTTATTGAPILADALAWMDCTIRGRHVTDTHTIYIGEIQATTVPDDEQKPLVYWNRGYRTVSNEPETVTETTS